MAPKKKQDGAEKKAIEAQGWGVGPMLGEGAFGKVYLVTRTNDETTAACKIIEKPKDLKQLKMIEQEYQLMKSMDHPYVVKCYDTFESPSHAFLFLELMTGGELFDKIVSLGSFTEMMAASITYKCLNALKYIHDKGIVHRDLKPENLLLADKTENSAVKLTDFGLSHLMDAESSLMTDPCGTPAYVAPEILTMKNGGYDKGCDVWSMGVIIYILLCGFPPFSDKNDARLYAKIKRGAYAFIKPYWNPISDEAKNFVAKMLIVDPRKRASIEDLLRDPWMAAPAKAARNRGSIFSPISNALLGPASDDEFNLKLGGDYHIKETENEAKLHTKTLKGHRATKRIKMILAMSRGKDTTYSKPLPKGWAKHLADDGMHFYYWCDATGQSLWERPDDALAVETNLPMGWSVHLSDAHGVPYYWNEHTGANQWEVPTPDQATEPPRVARPRPVERRKTPAARPNQVKVQVKQDQAVSAMVCCAIQ